jgi:hypothetical protein
MYIWAAMYAVFMKVPVYHKYVREFQFGIFVPL